MLDRLRAWLAGEGPENLATAAAILFGAWLLARVLSAALWRDARDPRTGIMRKVVWFGLVGGGLFAALHMLGFDLSGLLVTGGLVTVAVGFASQAAVSNIISGLFLAGDEPFAVGDYVRVGDVEGVVLQIDLLSTKLRTLQNVFVRVPNEVLLRGNIHNMSRFARGRVVVVVGGPAPPTPAGGRGALRTSTPTSSLALLSPEPVVLVEALGEYAVRVQLRTWVETGQVVQARDQLTVAVRDALAAQRVVLGARLPGIVAKETP